MAVSSETVAVTSTATALNTASTSGVHLVIGVPTADISLGDSTVTDGTGFTHATTDSRLTVEIDPGDVLFAATAATADVEVLRT